LVIQRSVIRRSVIRHSVIRRPVFRRSVGELLYVYIHMWILLTLNLAR
jgi:hypothetical protein